jgi:beta-galactosidase GanA
MDYTKYSNYPLGAPKLDPEDIEPFTADYALVAPMMRDLAQWSFDGKVSGVSEPAAEHSQTVELGKWRATVSYGLGQFGPTKNPPGNEKPSGGVFFVTLGPDEFLVAGYHARVDFAAPILRVEEGHYEQGRWVFDRIWNGDQTDWGLNFTSLPQLLKVRLIGKS